MKLKFRKKSVLLSDMHYCHVINKWTGKVKLVNGPGKVRILLGIRKKIHDGPRKKMVLDEETFAVIKNPYDKKKKRPQYGDREVRIGPQIFPLYPGETTEGLKDIYILKRGTGISLRALTNFADDDGEVRDAGDEWIVMGPTRYVPSKYVEINGRVYEKSLEEHSGVYVKNKNTGKLRLEKGAKSLVIGPDEELWKKGYTKSEVEAIRFEDSHFDRTIAWPLWVLENEVTKIMSEIEQRIVFGPEVILLEPHERPYVMTIAGGTPKNSKRLQIWKIKLGPNFSTDIIEVRTKDNAVLNIRLRYQWRFETHHDDPKWDPEIIFGTSDFVGLATEMMASIIREESAKYDFEELHSRASEIVKNAIFKEKEFYEFENGLRVFGIDIKEIKPRDKEIAKKMNNAIKSNMEIYVDKMHQNAEIEARKTKIEGEKIIEKEKTALLVIEHENLRKQSLIKTEIEAEQIKIRADANALQTRVIAEGDADAIRIKSEATARAEIDKIEKIMTALGGDVEKYLELRQILGLASIKKTLVVPTDAHLYLPLGKEILEK